MNRRKVYVGLTVFLAATVAAVYWWAKQPSVSNPMASTSQVKAATTDEFVSYENDYVAMQIPKRFTAKQPVIGTGKPLFVQQLLTVPLQNGGGVFSDQLAIVVGTLPPGGLSEVSDVQLRARSAEYTSNPADIANTIVYESVKQSTYEIGYFTSRDKQYASIVLTTTLANAVKAKEQTNNIMRSLVWRN